MRSDWHKSTEVVGESAVTALPEYALLHSLPVHATRVRVSLHSSAWVSASLHGSRLRVAAAIGERDSLPGATRPAGATAGAFSSLVSSALSSSETVEGLEKGRTGWINIACVSSLPLHKIHVGRE